VLAASLRQRFEVSGVFDLLSAIVAARVVGDLLGRDFSPAPTDPDASHSGRESVGLILEALKPL
jgi:hypothetical protein